MKLSTCFLISLLILSSLSCSERASTEQDQWGSIERATFPSRKSLFPTAKRTLYDKLHKLHARPIYTLSQELPELRLYELMTIEARSNFRFRLTGDLTYRPPDELRDYLAPFVGAKLRFDREEISAELSAPDPNQVTKGIEKFAVPSFPFLFEQNEGLLVHLESLPYSIYFLPAENLVARAFSVYADGRLNDESYWRLCDRLRQIREPLFYQILWRTVLDGIDPEQWKKLRAPQQELLLNVTAIALAEEYFFQAKGVTLEQKLSSHRLLNIVFLSLHLANFGELAFFHEEKPELYSGSCHRLLVSSRPVRNTEKRHKSRILNEVLVSSYLQKHHPGLFENLKRSLEDDNVFRGLDLGFLRGTRLSEKTRESIDQMFVVLAAETETIEAWIAANAERISQEQFAQSTSS